MTVGLFANPNQTVILAVQTLNSDGVRTDGYIPTIGFVLNPSGVGLSGYPIAMTAVSTGLYNYGVSIPSGSVAVGTYIASITWTHPTTGYTQAEVFLISVALPFGSSSVSPA